MNTDPLTQISQEPAVPKTGVKIFGIGGAGVTMLEQMLQGGFAGASFAAVNTDAQLLNVSSAPEKYLLETKPMRGLGTGGDPERGRTLAEANLAKLKAACEGAETVLLAAGLGGGAGTGITPVLARAAKSAGALVLAFVTLPFDCEGNRRQRLALQGLDQLRAEADGVICLPNQKMFRLMDENVSVLEAFETTSRSLLEGVRGVWRLLSHTGLIQIHHDDLCSVLRERHGESCFAAAEAEGGSRSREVVGKLMAHPMLDKGDALGDAESVLVSIVGGPDLTMAEVNRVMEPVSQRCPQAHVIMGAAIDESLRGRLAVTLIALRDGGQNEPAKSAARETAEPTPDLDTQLLERKSTSRPASRFVPPAPTLTAEQRDQIISRQAGARAQKRKVRMTQTQLPLDIVHKGRFDKSEPTIHRGEDLDVPTFIRRGVALN